MSGHYPLGSSELLAAGLSGECLLASCALKFGDKTKCIFQKPQSFAAKKSIGRPVSNVRKC